jgi:hypothetical protein
MNEVVITKKTIPIPVSPEGMRQDVGISMTHDGINNFSFALTSFTGSIRFGRSLEMWGVGSRDGFKVEGNFYDIAMPLSRGAKIGPSTDFQSVAGYPAFVESTENGKYGTYSRGPWGGNHKNYYLGVRFQISGQTHYGWIRFTVTTDPHRHEPSMTAEITASAYETAPNEPIKAGTASGTAAAADVQAPEKVENAGRPSLGMLAAGAEAMPLWRREESSVHQ